MKRRYMFKRLLYLKNEGGSCEKPLVTANRKTKKLEKIKKRKKTLKKQQKKQQQKQQRFPDLQSQDEPYISLNLCFFFWFWDCAVSSESGKCLYGQKSFGVHLVKHAKTGHPKTGHSQPHSAAFSKKTTTSVIKNNSSELKRRT